MSLATRLALVAAGLATGNFIYQYFGAGDYATAFMRSFFQSVALLAAYVSFKIGGAK